jgi:hypothetical protein
MGWYSSPQEVGNLGRSYHLSLGLPLRDVKISLSGYAAFDRGYLRKVVRSSSAPFCRRATLLHLMIPIGKFSSRRNLDVSQRNVMAEREGFEPSVPVLARSFVFPIVRAVDCHAEKSPWLRAKLTVFYSAQGRLCRKSQKLGQLSSPFLYYRFLSQLTSP